MGKNNWTLGILISVVVSAIISLPRAVRADSVASWGNLLSSFIYLLPFCLLCWLAHSWINSHPVIRSKIGNTFLFTFLAIISVAALSVFYDRFYAMLFGSFFHGDELYRMRKPFIISVRSIIISGLYYFIVYYLNLLTEKQKNSLEIEYLKQAQLQAELSSLKEQLSPHFLFNTLNTLTTLTKEPEVKKYVDELANVYRYVLQYKENDSTTLQNELKFIESYLYIIKIRLEDAIQITIQVDKELLQSKIPPLTLQILIENVIKHNIATESDPLKIKIYNKESIWLIVQNKFLPKSSVMHTIGIGLNNITQRYLLLFGKEIIIEKSQKMFTIKLPIVP